jgi:hypothetical protein
VVIVSSDITGGTGALDAPLAFAFLVLMVKGNNWLKPNQKKQSQRIYFQFFNEVVTLG